MSHDMSNGGIRDSDVGVPRAEDGRVLESIGHLDWTVYEPRPTWAPHYAEGAETSFVLPVAAQALYLLARGSHQGGDVVVTQATRTSTGTEGGGTAMDGGDEVRVDVRVAYHDRRALARATVCRLRKSGNRHGVGIYTPIPSHGPSRARDRLHFEVTFTFPAAQEERSPVRVRAFTTHTSNYSHAFGDLWRSLVFDKVELDASNATVRATSITLKRGTLTTSNADVVGHFNASDALVLRTSNARISATASLYDRSQSRDPTELEMQTSNGGIVSAIELTTASGTGGAFHVVARSCNGLVDVRYDDAPSRSKLVSDVRTSNASASVVMHPTFEGAYEVSTSNARADVREPRGDGRVGRRIVRRTTGAGRVEGSVYLENEGARIEGVSRVHTSNARATLDL